MVDKKYSEASLYDEWIRVKNMAIIRVYKKEDPYVIIEKTGINDVRLSWKARDLFCYLLSKPNDWKIDIKHLMRQGPDGERAIRSGLKELEKYGYIITEPVRDEGCV